MNVQATRTQSTMFLPIILFSIILPFIDIVTDLRLIIKLYSKVYNCIGRNDKEKLNITSTMKTKYIRPVWNITSTSGDLLKYCQQYPMPDACTCILENDNNFATILLGECTNV